MIKRNLLVIGLAGLLGACGFQLRGLDDVEFSIKELDVSARNKHGETVREVKEILEKNGVKVFPGAAYKLYLSNEQSSQRAASHTTTSRTAEYENTLVVDYQIRGERNLPLLSNRIEVQGYFAQDANNLVSNDEESVTLNNELRRDLVQQLLQQLRQISPQQLDTLQQTANAKAKAEAEAMEAARQYRARQPQQSPLEIPDN